MIDLRVGDCREVLRTLADNSVDSIVTDPPYHLTTGKKGGTGEASVSLETPHGRARVTTGFMGMVWDGGDVAFQPEVWRECLRVLKPGGHLLAFSGTRTYHRMVCAIEDAGFEVRDQIGWVYGSGFPKSRNVASDMDESYNAAVWQGWGTALKPAWEPICVARKPLDGTVARNVLTHGTGALNIDGCRVPTDDKLGGGDLSACTKVKAEGWDRPWMQDEAAKAAHASRVRSNVARAETIGRWPANLIHDGSDEVLAAFPQASGAVAPVSGSEPSGKTDNTFGDFKGRAPSDRCDGGGSAARFFYCAKASRRDRNEGLPSGDAPAVTQGATMREREDAQWSARNGNHHPTVKPEALMRYLCRLVTPPGGLVLDPFMGSGSTGKGAVREGFRFIGIELSPEYAAIARARIEAAAAEPESEGASETVAEAPATAAAPAENTNPRPRARKPATADGAQADLFLETQ